MCDIAVQIRLTRVGARLRAGARTRAGARLRVGAQERPVRGMVGEGWAQARGWWPCSSSPRPLWAWGPRARVASSTFSTTSAGFATPAKMKL